jgi:hypothetical protein
MPGRQPVYWGMPLWQAIERWTPRQAWEKYRELAEYDIPLIIPGREEPRAEEVRSLRARIAEVLIDKLARGELIASGIALPLRETSRRRDIRPELWARLTFSYRFLTVVGNGLKYDQVLIREAWPATASATEREQEAARPPEQLHQAVRGPGRPSLMGLIEAEMRRRARSGQIERSLRREAEVLAMWANQEFPDEHVPKPKSIEKPLGPIYKELKATKSPDKWGDR